jgi:flagellar motor switch protein FliN
MMPLSPKWVQQVEKSALLAQEIPLWGAFPPIDWGLLSRSFSELLNIPSFELSFEKSELLSQEHFLEGFGEKPVSYAIELTPLPSSAYLVMSHADVSRLSRSALSLEGDFLFDASLERGFYHFLLLACLETLSSLSALGDLSPTLLEKSLPEEREALTLDLRLKCEQQTLWLRILCPLSLHSAVQKHFSHAPPLLSSSLRAQMLCSIAAQIGQVTLFDWEWQQLKVGDLIALDHCSYHPLTGKGSTLLCLGETPLFRARIKEGFFKIADYAFDYETGAFMEKDDQDLPEDFEDENFDEDLSSVEEELSEREEQTEELVRQTSKEIPITLTVEMGRIALSLEKIFQLQPGNLLEIPLNPQKEVSLTIQGKKVASGELVALGDLLGVRILYLS